MSRESENIVRQWEEQKQIQKGKPLIEIFFPKLQKPKPKPKKAPKKKK
jgi:hypothetical protein